MKAKFLVISCCILVLTYSCNSSSDSKAKEGDSTKAATADTAVAVVPAPAPAEPAAPVIDSAAVTKEFLAAQNKNKKAAPAKPKKQGKNEVVVYNEPTIPSHEALETPKNQPPAERVVYTKEYVYYLPSTNASYPGGQSALNAYMKKNLVYPEEALKYHVEGTVYAEVTIDSLGYVKKVEYPGTHLGSGLEEETTTVLMGTPRWLPAKNNGVPVKSKITVPVVYKITH